MRFRTLRIAFSVLCGIACLLLIVLWVRSYWWKDELGGDVGGAFTSIGTQDGQLIVFHMGQFTVGVPLGIHTFPRLVYDPTTVSYSDPYSYSNEQAHHPLGFGWDVQNDIWEILLPLWFPTLIITIFGIAPWLPWFRWRFTTRTLLIATTLVAVVLGVIVWAAR